MTKENQKSAPQLKKHNISMLTVFFMIFCMVCAGAYGIEDMIPASGPGLTLLLLLVLPFFWSIPQGLVAAELGSAIPEEGGYYKWIQRALGEFWGFQAGWWRTLSIYIDSTLYIVLAAGYLGSFVSLTPWQSFAVKAVMIVFFTYINLRGLSDVGRITAYFSVIVMVSFVVLIVAGFANWTYNPFVPFVPPGQSVGQSIGLGVAICLWMYAGYESMSTMAGEVENPQVIPKATLLSVPVIMLFYILSTVASLAAFGNWDMWATEGGVSYVTVAKSLGIPLFGLVFGIAAIISNLSLYNTYLASGSRGFYSMSEDGLMPKFFGALHPKYGTPYKAILSMMVVNLVLCQYGFDVLVVVDVFLLMFAYILIYIAAVVLRVKEPNMPRLFKVPLGTKGLTIMCIPPILLAVLALFTNGTTYFIGGCLGILSGPIFYVIFKRLYGGMDGQKIVIKKDKVKAMVLGAVAVVMIAGAAYLVVGERTAAHEAIADYLDEYGARVTADAPHYDWAETLYAFDVHDPAQPDEALATIYYDEDFYAAIDLDQHYDSELAFAEDAFEAANRLAALALPVAWVDISSANYVLYVEDITAYPNAEALAEDVAALF